MAIIGLGAMVLVMLFAAGQWLRLRVNLTPSYPLGLWRIVPLEQQVAIGDLVFICLRLHRNSRRRASGAISVPVFVLDG